MQNKSMDIISMFATLPTLDLKVRGPFVQTLCIEKESYIDAI